MNCVSNNAIPCHCNSDAKICKGAGKIVIDELSQENRCYNKGCEYNNKNGACKSGNAEKLKCDDRDTKQPTPINYEEEYNKLKKENLGYTLRLNNQGKRISTDGNQIQKQFQEIEELMKERDNYKEIAESQNKRIEELENTIKEKDEHIRKLNSIIDRKDKDLDVERKGNTLLNSQLENELGRNRVLTEKLEELKKQNNQGYMEQMNITIKDQKETLERLEKSANEYYCNWIEAQKETEHEKQQKDMLRVFLESRADAIEKENKQLKEAIKTLASLL